MCVLWVVKRLPKGCRNCLGTVHSNDGWAPEEGLWNRVHSGNGFDTPYRTCKPRDECTCQVARVGHADYHRYLAQAVSNCQKLPAAQWRGYG